MSVEALGTDGSVQSTDGAPSVDRDAVSNEETKSSDKVDYSTYDKVLRRLKKTEADFKRLADDRDRLASEKLEAEGNKDEALKSLKARLAEKDEELNSKTKSYATKVIGAQVSSMAESMGCVDSEMLMKTLDFGSVEIGDDFNVDTKALRASIEAIRKSKSYLFKATVKDVADSVPSSKVRKQETGIDTVKKMRTSKEIIEAVRSGRIKI